MFIVPLILAFLLGYFGTTWNQLLTWMNQRAATVKLGTGMLVLLLPCRLGYSIVTF